MRFPETKIDAATERLMAEALERRAHALSRRQRAVEVILSALTISLALALAIFAEADRSFAPALAVAFVVAYGVVARVGFNLGDGYVVPTQLVFIPMLLLLPTPLVPLLVIAGVLVARTVNIVRGTSAPQRLLLAGGDAAFALVPAAVLVALGAQLPEWAAWPAYVAALSAQFAVDTIRDTALARLTGTAPARAVLRELAQSHRVDALLAPIGLLAAIAAAGAPATALLVLPLVSLLAVFAREREARIAHTIELGHAYRGTALLLCDLLEDDDEYTGHHTQDVVGLSVRVAERMGVSEDVRRECELGAMLHDIGKIAIPDAIINKPGPLDDAEWALMKTHTIEGQRMLDRVGGQLGNIGLVVRGSHERFDGAGYPDGLAGEAIPLASRIVSACDAFNAMTTTRSYRKAMPVAAAVDELRHCSGTQFDPAVVSALVALVDVGPEFILTTQSSAPYASARNSGSVARNGASSSSGIVTVTPVTCTSSPCVCASGVTVAPASTKNGVSEK
jgi:HD-GYP domain-containing protein (c-di-GMP phosphodiesterase class II)